MSNKSTTMRFTVLLSAFLMLGYQAYAQKMEMFQSKTMKISYPSDWKANNEANEMVEFFIASPLVDENDLFSENVNLVVAPSTGTLDTQMKESKDGMEQMLNATVKEEGKMKVGGIDARFMVSEFAMSETKLTCYSILLVKNGNLIVITCTAASGDYKAYFPTFKKMVESITLS
ncbi:MAG: hypothetical protein SFW35_07205 [Chitinophagales bacterium]|nr:hypothetical protein [Chitinophagales bacterium]